MDLHRVRGQLLDLHRSGQEYRFLDFAWRYLAAVPSDPEIAERTLSMLLEVGLGGVAREMLQSRQDLGGPPGGEAHDLVQQITTASGGRVSWVDHKQTFQRNLGVLLARHPHLAGIEAELEGALRGVHLYRTAHHHHLISRRPPGQLREWLPGITDYAQDMHIKLPELSLGTPVFVSGLSLGSLTERLYEETATVGLNQNVALFLLEPDLANLAAWLHIKDRQALLDDDRVYLFCGPNLFEALERVLDDNPDLAVSSGYVITPAGFRSLQSEVTALHTRVLQRRVQELRGIENDLRRRRAERSPDYWQSRLQHKGLVVALTSRATTMLQFSARDIGHALEELGYSFELLIEAADHRPLTHLQIARSIRDLDPMLIILLDHLRYEHNAGLHDVPVLTWVQDPLPNILCRRAGDSIGPVDFVCGYYKDRCVEEYGYPADQFFEVTIPASARVFYDTAPDPEALRKYDSDVIYVGHRSATPPALYEEWRARCAATLHGLLRRIHEEVAGLLQRGEHFNVRGDPQPLVDSLARDLNLSLTAEVREQLARYFAYRLFDIGYRRQTLSWAADWADRTGRVFRIYGNGWAEDPDFSRFAAGPLQHGDALRVAYRCARLALQTIPSGFLHQRTYEALLSGALVLTRDNPKNYAGLDRQEFEHRAARGEAVDCAGLFFPRLPEIVFANTRQFAELADLHLARPALRKELQQDFRRCVEQRFTYTSVMRGVMDGIRKAARGSVTGA